MDTQTNPYQIVDLTPERQVWLNILDLPRLAHPMYGLLEVDVTVPRQFIAEHKARTGERIEVREILNLTVIFGHNVVDGAPAARFTKRLVELIESGYELETMENQCMSSSIIEEREVS